MSMAWEVTADDVELVLEAHNVKFTDDIFELVDDYEVENVVLEYTDFDDQVSAALCEIEDQLITAKIITAPKEFTMYD